MTELFLVRHGETEWNRERRIQGRTDIPLNETGRAQARATGALLARRRWDAVLSSPLSRARETASLIAAELGLPGPELIDGVIERNYGDAEGLNFHEVDERFPEGTDVPGRESRDEVAERVVPALVELARQRLSVAEPGVSHGMITNGSVHSFRVIDGTLRLIAFDDPIEFESIGADTGALSAQNAVEARDRELT